MSIFVVTYDKYICNEHLWFLSDLPDDTLVVDLHKLIGLNDRKMPKMEKTGERMLRDVKEWMLWERSNKECAMLPEDTIQCIIVRVSNY